MNSGGIVGRHGGLAFVGSLVSKLRLAVKESPGIQIHSPSGVFFRGGLEGILCLVPTASPSAPERHLFTLQPWRVCLIRSTKGPLGPFLFGHVEPCR